MQPEIEALQRQMLSLRREVRQLTEWQDTVSSPKIKRVWWWLQGYRWNRVGRWYRKTSDLK